MELPVKISSALISVYYKDNLEPIVLKLKELGVVIYSTGGTAKFIQDLGVEVKAVEDLTGYPSILGGRVKTLHPKVFGGILARRENLEDRKHLAEFEIPELDLVIVDLYPFEETIKAGGEENDIIEKIDIGGVSLIRAAAKNFKHVLTVASKDEYKNVFEILNAQNGISTIQQRKELAKKAFAITSAYDGAINGWFTGGEIFELKYNFKTPMRYGENPHQSAAFYGGLNLVFDQLHGKEISYNNLVDIESCIYLMEEFDDTKKQGATTFAIIKHTNACGLATDISQESAWKKALAADPVSAFGGVLISNTELNEATANLINELFFEVIIAPGFSENAVEILKTKKNRIILKQKLFSFPGEQFKSMLNGILVQGRNKKTIAPNDLKYVTTILPTDAEIEDLLFAEKAVKHLKSNGIALVKNKQLIGCGTGQTSRVDALNQAINKARNFGFDVSGAAMASEAFFPFPDCVQIAHEAGIRAVIQPGGSVRDKESVEYCNDHGMAMVLTGLRHFKH